MTRHKSFGSANPYAEAEPVSFDIYNETFICHSAVQGGALLRFGRDAKSDPSEAVLNFFETCMPEEEFERFKELMESPDKIVDAGTLGEIAGYLVSEYSTRPTERSSSSSNGPSKSRASSARKR